MNLKNNRKYIFRFKQFSIVHKKSAMKVGFDGILLGAWIDVENDYNVLDVGTGSGLIALMIAQRNVYTNICAIEPDYASYMEANYNFTKSPWGKRLYIANVSLQNYTTKTKFDHIVCNPPYFKSGKKSNISSIARHTVTLTHEELLYYSLRVLKVNGRLSVILPVLEGLEFIDRAKELSFGVSRLFSVFTKNKIERLLIELKYEWFGKTEEKLLKIYDESGNYSADYKEIVEGYYLNV